MLGKIAAFIRKYVVVSDEQLFVLTIWILHSWMCRALPNTAYLNIQSPGPGCGKTRLLKLLELFGPPGSWFTAGPAPHLFIKKLLTVKPAETPDKPSIHELPSAVFLDDREFTLGSSDNNAVISCLINGFRASNRYLYQHERSSVREFSVFCPKAFAGVAPLPRALAQRCIPVDLKRKLSSEKVEDFDLRFIRVTAQPLLDWLKAWSALNLDVLQGHARHYAMTPSERFNVYEAEFVRPLLVLAHLVEGKWLDNLHASLQWLKLRSATDTAPEGIQLLTDLRRIFDERKNPAFIPSLQLVEELKLFEHRPWATWKGSLPHKIGRLLRPFGIRSTYQHTGDNSRYIKVYLQEDLKEAWERYA
jgi:hypothetical protein